MSDAEQEQKVRARAYAIWEAEGRPQGKHEQHWQDAVRELAASAADAAGNVAKTVRRTVKKVTAAVPPEANSVENLVKDARAHRAGRRKKD